MTLLALAPELIGLIADQLLTDPSYFPCNKYQHWKNYSTEDRISHSRVEDLAQMLLPLLRTNHQLNAAVTPTLRQLMRREKDQLLLYAAYSRKMLLAETMLELGANINACTFSRQRPLHLAAQGKDETMLAMLLQRNASVAAIDNRGNTALHIVANDQALVKLLVDAGADLNTTNNIGYTPLHIAVATNHSVQPARYLLERGAIIPESEPTLLERAIEYGHVDTIRLLLENGAKPCQSDNSPTPVLHLAVCRGYNDIVDLLLQYGASLHALDRKRISALDCATINGYKTIATYLLNRGGKYAAEPQRALKMAVESGSDYGVKIFAQNGASVHDDIVATAIAVSNHQVLGELINLGIDPNACLGESDTLLRKVATLEDVRIAKVLVDAGALIDLHSPLHCAARCSNLDMVQFLLLSGARADDADENGQTPLHLLVSESHTHRSPEILNLLIQHGANINTCDKNKMTPLHLAVKCPEATPLVVKALLAKGATIEARTVDGETPLLIAVRVLHQDPEIVEVLLRRGANVYACGVDGSSALYLAVAGPSPDEDMIRLLLESGATVDPDINGVSTAARWVLNEILEEMGLERLM